MHVFIVVCLPAAIALIGLGCLLYTQISRPAPLPLGNIYPLVCAVIWDEIRNHCEHIERANVALSHLHRQTRSNQASVSRGYVDGMASNTKVFFQVVRFEEKKIDPRKPSLQYEPWETVTLRLVDEASALHWFLVKAQARFALSSLVGIRLSGQAIDKMLHEYKQLEQDFLALVRMASDEVYYNMLVERLGLSDWRLIEGGDSSAS